MNLEPEIFEFLKKLKKNNNRPWFKDNKSTFDTHNSNVKKYFSNFFDNNKDQFKWESFKVFRIYKDVRFSKDKTPYKTHFAIDVHRTKTKYRGGCYIDIQRGNTDIERGFGNQNKMD